MQEDALLLQVLKGKCTTPVPVWAMRQAGRVLASYRKLRNKVGDFKRMVNTPALATEITLLPVQDLGVDAAIIFSDILVIPEAMGFPYKIKEGHGPYFTKYLRTEKDVEQLQTVAVEEQLSYVLEALTLTRRALPKHIPLIGFSGAPWTILAYLLEGGGSTTYSRARSFLYQHPKAAHNALTRISVAVIDYLKAQGRSGADCLQLFDTLAEKLPPALYAEFGLPYVRRVAHALQGVSHPPFLLFVKGGYHTLADLCKLPCAGISIDWATPLVMARDMLASHQKVLQGNFDPALLYAPREQIANEVRNMLQQMEGQPYIANLGHGLYPDIPEDNVRFWVETVQNISALQKN